MADTGPEALERDIERTRAELAYTVDAIVDRVSPKRVAERGVAKVKANAGELVAAARDLVAGHPPRHAELRAYGGEPAAYGEDDGWQDDFPARNLAPILIGVGAIVVVGALIAIRRRRTR
ncbi:DUF3618 domain-containing protein [Sphaerisporangium corydalis]|uniref:DUF3618 domain-containing protein n=1 Tax=Sphaerisporangium corydalis TaxID=1441875 RepID=A0ABV9EKH7_9ACTN|nr:DUF3618 domain-containing protein [Sphaerisporangium corydalis]